MKKVFLLFGAYIFLFLPFFSCSNEDNSTDVTNTESKKSQTYTVYFEPNGAYYYDDSNKQIFYAIEQQEFTIGVAQRLRKNTFNYPGCVFSKWEYTVIEEITASDGTTSYKESTAYCADEQITKNLSTIPTVNVYLRAIWKAADYTVVFDKNGGEGKMSEQYFAAEESQSLSKNTFTRENFTFSGWNTKADGTGTNYFDGSSVKNLGIDNGSTVTLYAQWKENLIITYNANGGTGVMPNQTIKYSNSSVTIIINDYSENNLTKNKFTRENYGFVNWNTSADGSGSSFSDGQFMSYRSDVHTLTLYAQWKKDFVVIYNANGGTGTMENQQFSYNIDKTLSRNTFTKDDYSFSGWNTKADGTGTNYPDGTNIKNLNTDNEESITLYAQWRKDFTIIFDANGGTGAMPHQSIKIPYTSASSGSTGSYSGFKLLSKNIFNRENYIFTSWNTSADGSGVSYADEQQIDYQTYGTNVVLYIYENGYRTLSYRTDEYDFTLYAQWESNVITTTMSEVRNLTFGSLDTYKIIVSGEYTDLGMQYLAERIKNTSSKIYLDMSQVTGDSISLGTFFNNCTNLTGIVLGKGVSNITYKTFYGCTSLSEIIIDEQNQVYKSIDGILYSKDETELILCPRGRNEEVSIHNNTKRINSHAFSNTSISTIEIPVNITEIGSYAFNNSSLQTAYFEDRTGWKYYTNSSSSGGTINISEDPKLNAEMLTNGQSYNGLSNCTWKKE